MYIFKPYEKPIKKQIYIPGIPSGSITDKTIMRQITKNDDFYLLNTNNIIVDSYNKSLMIEGKTYVVTIDNSVWIIKDQSTDMDGTIIPSTYNLLLLGKLEPIEIDMEKIKENEEKSSYYDEYRKIIGYYNFIVTYITNIYDRDSILESLHAVDWDDIDSVYSHVKYILEYRHSENKKLKSKIEKLKFGIIFIIIICIISLLL